MSLTFQRLPGVGFGLACRVGAPASWRISPAICHSRVNGCFITTTTDFFTTQRCKQTKVGRAVRMIIIIAIYLLFGSRQAEDLRRVVRARIISNSDPVISVVIKITIDAPKLKNI